MCGRFYCDEDENERILTLYKKAREKYPENDISSGDIYPGDIVPILDNKSDICINKWGLENPYKKNAIIINSRSETINQKFKDYFENKRIVIPCSGYYEWNDKKEKYYFNLDSREVLFMCGISTGSSPNDRFSIITREASDNLKMIHNRMPLILEEKSVNKYLLDNDFAKYILSTGIENITYSKC